MGWSFLPLDCQASPQDSAHGGPVQDIWKNISMAYCMHDDFIHECVIIAQYTQTSVIPLFCECVCNYTSL